MRWVLAYETDDPDPASRNMKRDVTAHAYDQRAHEPAHHVVGSYRVAPDESWKGLTARGIRCPECKDLMAEVDQDELV